MANSIPKQKIVVIGAGPVGALSAIYAAQRGHDVEVYELRNDLRDPSTTPLNFTKSINLALSERGINAMRKSGRPELLEKVFKETIPMKGRMIHGKTVTGEFYEQSQEYDIHGRTIFAVDRGELNKNMLDELESMPNVKFFFNHKLTGADFRQKRAWFEVLDGKRKNSPLDRYQEIEISFDLLIGADGAHSAARYHLMKFTHMDYQQEYIEDLWCEFTIPPKTTNEDDPNRFAISPNHLHIWPGQDFMFIAIPSNDGSFTCTLFMPAKYFRELETKMAKTSDSLPEFFDSRFPGVTSLISPDDLIASFNKNPKLPLISIKCQPHHYQNAAVIVGDAAHAMVPFYGQGMNAGLEDVRVLFSFIDQNPENALAAYSEFRKPDAHAINDLALQNYTEMRASVTSPSYKFRKWLEEKLSVYVPSLGWQTKYSRVSFGNERYSEVVNRSERQGKLLVMGLVGILTAPAAVGVMGLWYRWGVAGQRGARAWWGLGNGRLSR